VRLDAITFVQAMPLLADQRPVPRPEWTTGRAPSPAAVAGLPRVLTLDVALSCTQPGLRGRLAATRTGGTLRAAGHVPAAPVRFGTDGTAKVRMRVPLTTPCVDIGTVRWRWEFSDESAAVRIGTTRHEIAMTIAPPTPPWTIDHGGRLRQWIPPWWEVVRHACSVARGTTSFREAATLLARHTFSGFARGAYRWDDARNYATNGYEDEPAFDCARFLRLIDRRIGPRLVDCSDLAAVLSTFANILGCSLQQVVIGGTMVLNPVLLCGRRRWESRFTEFGLHEFTAIGPSEPRLRLWDACLEVSDDDAPERPGNRTPRGAGLPVTLSVKRYFDRLFFENEGTIAERDGRSQIRPIRELPPLVRAVRPGSPLVQAGRRFWRPPRTPGPAFYRVPFFSLYDGVITDWEPLDPVPVLPPPLPSRGSDAVTRIVWRSTGEARSPLISASVYVCFDVRAAHARTLALLGELTPLAPRLLAGGPAAPLGEYHFETARGAVLMGTLLNVVYVIRRASMGPSAADLRSIAGQVYQRIMSVAAPV
jgi:hypothetical protein